MNRPVLLTTMIAAMVVLSSSGALAQRRPGTPGGDGFSAALNMAEFYADVMEHTDNVLKRWRTAWAADDADELLELYTEDAVIIFEQDEPARGREAIREKLAALLQQTGEVQVSIGDFDASGRMGMISGLLTFEMQGRTGSRTMTGLHLTVLTRKGRNWQIRSQVIRLGTDTGRATRIGPPGGSGSG